MPKDHADWGDNRTSNLPAWSAEDHAVISHADDPELRQMWGANFDQYFAIASAAVTDICSRMSDPEAFLFKFENQLPDPLQNRVKDFLRIPRAKGRSFAALVAFEDSLGDAFPAWKEWTETLTPEEAEAIRSYFDE